MTIPTKTVTRRAGASEPPGCRSTCSIRGAQAHGEAKLRGASSLRWTVTESRTRPPGRFRRIPTSGGRLAGSSATEGVMASLWEVSTKAGQVHPQSSDGGWSRADQC